MEILFDFDGSKRMIVGQIFRNWIGHAKTKSKASFIGTKRGTKSF